MIKLEKSKVQQMSEIDGWKGNETIGNLAPSINNESIEMYSNVYTILYMKITHGVERDE